jgi:hypothetical protein
MIDGRGVTALTDVLLSILDAPLSYPAFPTPPIAWGSEVNRLCDAPAVHAVSEAAFSNCVSWISISEKLALPANFVRAV